MKHVHCRGTQEHKRISRADGTSGRAGSDGIMDYGSRLMEGELSREE